MKFLILTSDYADFLRWLYASQPGLAKAPYNIQSEARARTFFGIAHSYARYLRELGHEAIEVYRNNHFMQEAWLNEFGPRRSGLTRIISRNALAGLAYFRDRVSLVQRWPLGVAGFLYRRELQILSAQVQHYKPDVLLNHDMLGIPPEFLNEVRKHVRFLVGQHAATTLRPNPLLRCYDLAISSFPPTVDWFRSQGLNAQLHRLGFDPQVLSHLSNVGKEFGATFVGSFYGFHSSRVQLLEHLCKMIPEFQIWSPHGNQASPDSPIRSRNNGPVWGLDMYNILSSSRITLNHHGDVAPFANNLRMYEATGVGTLLITEARSNLSEMFEPGREVVAYRDMNECAEQVRYYLEHEPERAQIARVGHERTMKNHTYRQRMEEFVEILEENS